MDTIYAYWNGQQLYDIFNAVVLITGGAEANAYRQLMQTLALVAFLVSIGVGFAKLRATDTATAFAALTFFYGIFFVPTTTVHIQDVRNNTNYSVSNVPLGLAVFGSATSHVGYWLTNAYETYFTSVDDEKFSHYGMLFGQRLTEEMGKQDFLSPVIRENMTRFVKDCVNPEFVDNQAALDAMVKSNDLWEFVKGTDPGAVAVGFSINPGRTTVYIDSANAVTTPVACAGTGSALELLTAATTTEAVLQTKYLGDKMHPGMSGASALIAAQTPIFQATITGISQTAEVAIRHFSMMNMMRYANENQAGILASTMATAATESSYFSMKTLAEGALPKIRNLIEALVYSVFPIVFLLVIVAGAGGGKVLGTYAMTAVWVQLWAPLYAVINKLTYNNFSSASTLLTGGNGATIENMNSLMQMSVSDQALAGLLTVAVPMIALALVKGGEMAMSGVASQLMAPSTAAASKIGGEVGVGNVSGGNVNWGNASMGNSSMNNSQIGNSSMGQFQSAQMTSVGNRGGSVSSPSGTLTYDQSGSLTGASINPIGAAGASVDAQSQTGLKVTNASSIGERGSHGTEARVDNTRQAGYSAQSSAEFSRRLDSAVANRLGAEFRNNMSDGSTNSAGGDSRTSSGRNLTTEETAALASKLGLSVGGRDENSVSSDGRSTQTYDQPGGGGRAGGHGSTDGGKGSGNTLPAKAGEVGPDTRHSNTLARGASISGFGGVDAGVSGTATASQKLADAVKNEDGQYSRKEQQAAAQIMAAAVNDVMGTTTDSGIKSAGQKFMADNGFSTRATSAESAKAESYSDSGQRIEGFNGGSTGGSVKSEQAVFAAAKGLVEAEGFSGVAADQEAIRRLQSNEGFRSEATAAAMEGNAQHTNSMTGMGNMPAPRSQESIAAAAQNRVDAVVSSGEEQVAATNAKASSMVAGQQPFSPTSMPDTTPATSAYNSVKESSQSRQAQQSEDAAFTAGSNSLAAQLYENKEHGASKVASIAYLGGLGYDSPSEYSAAINKAAAQDPELRQEIAQYSNGENASEEDLERIFNKVSDKL